MNTSGRVSSVRSELLVPTVKTNGATPSEGGNSPPPQAKTFLRRLGIRKPSLMSLTSPLQTGRTARTFSLDDLLRPQVPSKVSTVSLPRTLIFSHRIAHYTYFYCLFIGTSPGLALTLLCSSYMYCFSYIYILYVIFTRM